MSDFDFTVTLELWWLVAWVGIGAVLFVPLNYVGHGQIAPRGPFWRSLWRSVKRNPLIVPVQIIAWPFALWELK